MKNETHETVDDQGFHDFDGGFGKLTHLITLKIQIPEVIHYGSLQYPHPNNKYLPANFKTVVENLPWSAIYQYYSASSFPRDFCGKSQAQLQPG